MRLAQWHLGGGHPLVALAVQEMVDCSSYTGPYGMGWVSGVHHGLDKAADYPLANHSDPTLVRRPGHCLLLLLSDRRPALPAKTSQH